MGSRKIRKNGDIGVIMDCFDEDLSPAQLAAYNQSEAEYKEITTKMDNFIMAGGGEIVQKGEQITVLQLNNFLPPPAPSPVGIMAASPGMQIPPPQLATPPSSQQGKTKAASGTTTPAAIAKLSNTPPTQAVAPSLVLQGSGQSGIVTRSSAGNMLHPTTTTNTFQLVMDPRLSFIVAQANNTNQVAASPVVIQTNSIASPSPSTPVPVVSQPTAGAVIKATPTNIGRSSKTPKPTSPAPQQKKTNLVRPLTAVATGQTTGGVANYRIKQETSASANAAVSTTIASPAAVAPAAVAQGSARSPAAVMSPNIAEMSSVGGLRGPAAAKAAKAKAEEARPIADNREVTFNKLSGKTFPSLVVIARPTLHSKILPQAIANKEKIALDGQIKNILMYTATKFTEYLIQQGLVRSEQYCTIHANADMTPVKLKLGMYSDVQKFPYSGGYVWISDCCPTRFVSVFSGSFFEGAPHPPSTLLKLMYHWACQTNIQNITQWVRVDNFYVKNFFTHLRAVCTAALHEKMAFTKMGGKNKKLEVGVISLGTTSHDGASRQVKVEVLGVMDYDTKEIRLRAVEPLQAGGGGERNFKRRFVKILEPLEEWVQKDSVILTDYTVDKGTLLLMGYNNVYQTSMNDLNANQSKFTNMRIMEYLRRVVPRMFQNTLSLLSRQIIQQFLDELQWREMYGPITCRAFEMMLKHLAEQTKLDTGDTLVNRLTKIAANPLKDWRYANWKSNCSASNATTIMPPPQSTVVEKRKLSGENKEPQKPLPIGIDNLPNSIRQTDPPLEVAVNKPRAPRKRLGSPNDAPEAKRLSVGAPSPIQQNLLSNSPKELKQLDSYYYGNIAFSPALLAADRKSNQKMKCVICKASYSNNLHLAKHLIGHALSDGFYSSSDNQSQCIYCLKTFTSDFALQSHIDEVHPLKSGPTPMCLICEEKFRDRTNLILHMHQNHVEQELPYQCHVCQYRSSQHRVLVDHFCEVHDCGEKVQCPYCLKVVAFENNGRKVTQNMSFFINHIQKHQRQIARKCNKCTLWFIHKGILKEHHAKDHVSFKDAPRLKRYQASTLDCVMMPLPLALGPMLHKKQLEKTKQSLSDGNFTINKFESITIYGANTGSTCCECEGSIMGEDHLAGYLSCLKCRFSTCCTKAMADHTIVFHDPKRPEPDFNVGSTIRLEKPMHCVCGFQSASGNKLAKHLVECKRKSAYPSPERAAQNTIQSQSASFPPLVTLDDQETSADQSEQWFQAYGYMSKKDKVEGVQEEADKVKNDAGPQSMLSMLGLVRRPSPEEPSPENPPTTAPLEVADEVKTSHEATADDLVIID